MAEEIDDDLTSFFNKEEEEDLASFLDKESEIESDDLAAFLEEEDDLASFLSSEEEELDEEDPLAAFFDEEDNAIENNSDDDGSEDEEDTGILGAILGNDSKKPEAALAYKKEKRKARIDITKKLNVLKRYTKRELEDQLERDYKFMLGKPYMMIQPVTIMADYPYKKKKNDSDAINDCNVEYDYMIVIGRVLRWSSTEEFKGKAYKLGEIMYMKRGIYWVDGKRVRMNPHFAMVFHKSYKRIKSKRIRDLLAPIKHRLRDGKPFAIYKEFPIIIERTGVYS